MQRRFSKIAVGQLAERIRLLENTLTQHNIPIPASSSPQSPPHHSTVDQWALLSGLTGEGPALPENQPQEDEAHGDREQALIERMDQGNSLSPGLDPDIELLMKRTSSLQFSEHGQLKYFGTTSNVHFLRTAIPFRLQGHNPSDPGPSGSLLELVNVPKSVPRELEDHLINLYLAWENPYFRVVDEDAFMAARRQVLSSPDPENVPPPSWYSELLVNAM